MRSASSDPSGRPPKLYAVAILGWLTMGASALAGSYTPTSSYTVQRIEGWKVLISPELDDEARDGLVALVGKQLADAGAALPATALAKIKQTEIWLEPESEQNESGAVYNGDMGWLEEKGQNPDKAFGIEITATVLDDTAQQPSFVMHELAHAYHQQALSLDSGQITLAFETAKLSGKYDSVDHVSGDLIRAYALVNELEFFAELTEAYYGTNDFFPFNRQELEAFDPASAEVIREAWMRE